MNDETTSHDGAVLERVRALLLAVVNNGNTEFQHEMDPTLEGWTLLVKEYRPWKTKAQFEKEIGKYVGAREVARLWRYVVIE